VSQERTVTDIPEGALVCKIDESVQSEADAGRHLAEGYDSVARCVIHSRENIPLGFYPYMVKRDLLHMLSFMAFACEHPSRRKRIAVDVNAMVKAWLPLVKKLALAHDVDDKDAASAALDEHLTPIIAAPVVQIREFYRKLTDALKADEQVPFAVWMMFEFYGTNVLDKIKREQELALKKELAAKIAERSMEQIPVEDWVQSMIGALMWRDPETLEKVDKSLEQGARPRVKGRESCLFLQVGEGEDKAEVML
jgi:hypothetical protein